MALANSFFVDTARYYPIARRLEKFTDDSTGNGTWTIGTNGPDSRYAHRLAWGNITGPPFFCRFRKTLSPADNTAITSFRWRRDALAGFTVVIAQIFSIGPFALASLAMNQDGTVSFIVGEFGFFGSDIRATSSASLAVGEYNHLEWHTTFGVSGTTTVYLNGGPSPILTYTGDIGTTQWSNGSWGMSAYNNIGAYNAVTNDYLDLVLRDGTARVWKDGVLLAAGAQWGDTRVHCLLSQSGNGHYTDWTPLTGSNHGAMVDEAQEDGDTSYNYTTPAGNRDSYAMEDLPADVGQVLAVQDVLPARKESAGDANLNGFLRVDAVDYDGDQEQGLATSYQHILTPFTELSGVAISVENVNDAEGGPLSA